ncbi:hypothetical protein CK203_008621 [Vitis vinifera]|uniref:Uncharacterized protein n=1 Tax=Vitis vinifera TaxID=29760 RepID=A0A438KE31_VITVI|nr:hypothetical protein CK203_008621 [Vitis vinifera]
MTLLIIPKGERGKDWDKLKQQGGPFEPILCERSQKEGPRRKGVGPVRRWAREVICECPCSIVDCAEARVRVEMKVHIVLPGLIEVEDGGWMFIVLVAVVEDDTEKQVGWDELTQKRNKSSSSTSCRLLLISSKSLQSGSRGSFLGEQMLQTEAVKETHGKRSCVENNCYPHSPLLNLNSNDVTDWAHVHEANLVLDSKVVVDTCLDQAKISGGTKGGFSLDMDLKRVESLPEDKLGSIHFLSLERTSPSLLEDHDPFSKLKKVLEEVIQRGGKVDVGLDSNTLDRGEVEGSGGSYQNGSFVLASSSRSLSKAEGLTLNGSLPNSMQHSQPLFVLPLSPVVNLKKKWGWSVTRTATNVPDKSRIPESDCPAREGNNRTTVTDKVYVKQKYRPSLVN